jgi:hypothetical protein
VAESILGEQFELLGNGNREVPAVKIRWFGDPWPSEEHRAAVCESDADLTLVPLGHTCIECTKPFKESDRGVITVCSPRIWGGFDLMVLGNTIRVCAYHLSCWLSLVVGDELTHEVLSRMPGRQDEIQTTLSGLGGEESVDEVGGWRHKTEDEEAFDFYDIPENREPEPGEPRRK